MENCNCHDSNMNQPVVVPRLDTPTGSVRQKAHMVGHQFSGMIHPDSDIDEA
jgi:hypothetical protein